ncbi:hypothetical protein A3724_04450 [Alcanivorax sp. HI0033]|uniref:hypothetical protein n=1 Tax=unclassified Alcanivorax TaxID=2638842 RepID=UPI0007B94B86|nr:MULTISPECIES: hypothetical protein [unclassified Alcanivorax]KZX76250.1 hypothetical protein A3717_13130 [Alcanivorax sp. HI0013]KZX85413.1 hypothetical protein A3716_15230 [Alcanivorax sp. HI0011]KZY19063.1 hypothetical protein A3725_08840 [Alcanivorax sp. HI0035]KZX69393.1 hypothetical protein A3714_07785 [Alcanivorax sp. HI0007]KZY07998.1 hypothetical protein A3724_04450 [Alcanivorax sp. HI0033]
MSVKSIYLDWNVYVRLLGGDYSDLANSLNHAKSSGIVIPFSAVHINEATNIRSQKEISTRLNFISKLSNQIYFENSITNTGLVTKSPLSVYNTVRSTSKAEAIMKALGNTITRPLLMTIRPLLGLDPRHLNNIDPEKIWDEIDRAILSSKASNKLPPQFRESPALSLARLVLQYSNQRPNYVSQFRRSKNQPISRQDTMVSILYSLLESFGYHPEKKKIFERASRFNDALHCFYGIHSEICISEDNGFRMKSKAIASLLGNQTEFVHPNAASQAISGLI